MRGYYYFREVGFGIWERVRGGASLSPLCLTEVNYIPGCGGAVGNLERLQKGRRKWAYFYLTISTDGYLIKLPYRYTKPAPRFRCVVNTTSYSIDVLYSHLLGLTL